MNEIEVKNKFKDYFLTCLYKNGFRYIVKHREGLIEAVDLKDSDALVAEINRTQATVNISRMVVDNAALILRAHMARENTIGSNYEMPDVLQIESGKKE